MVTATTCDSNTRTSYELCFLGNIFETQTQLCLNKLENVWHSLRATQQKRVTWEPCCKFLEVSRQWATESVPLCHSR